MTGGWKQKSGWIQNPPASCVPSTFPFLSQPSVCLIVSRVRAYLTTDQQHGIPCFLKRGPLPDWPVWTREQMISGGAAEREDREDEAEGDKPEGTQPATDARPAGQCPSHKAIKSIIGPSSRIRPQPPSRPCRHRQSPAPAPRCPVARRPSGRPWPAANRWWR